MPCNHVVRDLSVTAYVASTPWFTVVCRELAFPMAKRDKIGREPSLIRAKRCKERGVARFDDGDCLVRQVATGVGDRQEDSATIRWVCLAVHEAASFEDTQHLRCHHRVGSGVLGELFLGHCLRVPGERGQQYKLDMGESERSQCRTLRRLPAVRDLPEHEAGAVVRRIEATVQPHAGFIAAERVAKS